MDMIEERLAHLIRANEELSDVVAEQGRTIERLERQVTFLMERARSDEGSVYLGDERPPHW